MPKKKDWRTSRDFLPGDRVRDFTRSRIGSVARRADEDTVRVRFEQDDEEEVRISNISGLDR